MSYNYLRKIRRSTRNRGLINTIKFGADDFTFRFRYPSLDLGGTRNLSELAIKGENRKHGVYFQAVNSSYFKRIFSNININVKKSNFLDFGCGKGKSLILAAELGFKKAYGVEFAKELYEISISNSKKLKNKFKACDIMLFHEDACRFEIPGDINVLFFHNPFDRYVMDQVVNNIESSLQKFKRKIYVIYVSPYYGDCFEQRNYNKIYELKVKNKVEAVVYKK